MKLNILILMAGPSDAFAQAGYQVPKNLIEINGDPLVQHVLASFDRLTFAAEKNLICVVRREENLRFHTEAVIRLIEPTARVVELDAETSGAACSALMAVEHINSDTPLLIVNGDQILDADLNAIVEDFWQRDLDGGIAVFKDVHPRWSFVKCDAAGIVIEAAEKRPISDLATAGFYYFRRGSDFVQAAMSMILKGASVNNLFYICPAYNELILQQKRIGVFKVAKSSYCSLATPAGVAAYAARLAAK